jgi:superfamily II DNA or RNA helicase/HKD family nuclease
MEQTEFIFNSSTRNFYNRLIENLRASTEFKMSVAFITYGGLQMLLDTLKELSDKNIPGQIITTSYQNFTKPEVLKRISEFKNIQLKIYVPPTENDGFHAKGYLFRQPTGNENEQWTIIIGSSNITGRALKSNVEWNVLESEQTGERQEPGVFAKSVLQEFNTLWQSPWAKKYSDDFLISYRDYLAKVIGAHPEKAKTPVFNFDNSPVIQPNAMQQEAIVKLDQMRKTGATKALAIAATGSGKTYMSVFDTLQVHPNHLLFVVHREDILRKAKESFDRVCLDKNYSSGFFTGSIKDMECKYLFATRDSLSRHYKDFLPESFDYIVLDEAHHAASDSYKEILSYFKPKFLLGLTATPERSDAGDIYSIFDNNVAVEIRLRDALAFDLVCPFHYFGITDIQGIDYTSIHADPSSPGYLDNVAKLLMISRRVDYIIEKMKFYGHDGDKAKVLGFCVTVEHAQYMAAEFNKRLSKNGADCAIALSGKNDVNYRMKITSRLEDNNDPLEVIFSVDIFNEGIDIPSVNEVLLLRPTDSSIIFVQQLGRGLRKLPDKEFVTVLDFIGNYQKSFLMAIALNGKREFDQDSLKVAVKNDFADIPNGTFITMDKITKQQILNQLENEKFMSIKYMKESYLSFKQVNGGKVPRLVDYLKHDGSIDPLRFTLFNGRFKTYLEFVAFIESDTHPELAQSLADETFRALHRFLMIFMPAKRIYEWAIVSALYKHTITTNSDNRETPINNVPSLSISDLALYCTKYIDHVDKKTIIHSCEVLSGKYFDSSEISRYGSVLINFADNHVSFRENVISALLDPLKYEWTADLIQYALLRYGIEFGRADYGFPFFKLYQEYSMRETALLCSYTKIHSSFRGQGLITAAEPDYFMFVNLHKGAAVREAINYKDKFLTRRTFQWQSPNSTSQSSRIGQNLIHNMERNIRLHLFVRKFENIEGIIQPFMYLGQVVTFPDSAKGDKPITMIFELENEVPEDIYSDLTTVV